MEKKKKDADPETDREETGKNEVGSQFLGESKKQLQVVDDEGNQVASGII